MKRPLTPREQHLRRVEKYKADRECLIQMMGGRCGVCDCCDWPKLEFHHITSRAWVCRKLSRWMRLKKYREEFEQRVLVLACRGCNASMGRPGQPDF